ncbi:MAG: hypothetical protein ACK4JY_13090 [Brevundimonas sp.]|uniref:hypothetical protein n=1 Tax=Brevundimonas sp. TaxID=1871086 RepID=UPI00391CC095
MTAATARPPTAMKRLAGVLSFVCLVLFLLAIEQKHTVAAVDAVRAEAGPAARRVADWAAGLSSGAADGFGELRSKVARQAASWRAAPPAAPVHDGVAADGTRSAPGVAPPAAGSLALVGAELRFGTGESIRTRPLRIARGRDSFAPGQTFAARLSAPADAQVELREVVAPARGQPVPPLTLCGGEPAGVAALLYRPDRTELMLFRTGTVGPDTPPAALCGVWSFPVR